MKRTLGIKQFINNNIIYVYINFSSSCNIRKNSKSYSNSNININNNIKIISKSLNICIFFIIL